MIDAHGNVNITQVLDIKSTAETFSHCLEPRSLGLMVKRSALGGLQAFSCH